MVTTEYDRPAANADDLARALHGGLPVREGRMNLAGVSTLVLEAGEGPPLVLLHGQGAFAESWGPVIGALAETHHVIAPDLPGLGRSVVDADRLDGRLVTEWLDALITQTGNGPPVLVGISLGGTVAAHYALEHGDRVRAIVLVDSGSLGRFRPAPGALVALLRYVNRPSPAAFGRFGRYALAHPEAMRPPAGAPAAAGPAGPPPFVTYHVDRACQPSVRAANRRLVRWSTKPIPAADLRTIRTPVSLIWGRDDRIMRFRTAARVSREVGWPLFPIDDCGHVPFVDQPAAFLDALGRAIGTAR